jgi:uncharacterized protein (TIRG00374 family)
MQEPTRIPLKKRFFNVSTLLSFAIALALLVFLIFRLDVDLSATWARIKAVNPFIYALAFLVYYSSFPLRAWRWKLLLVNAGFEASSLPTLRRLTSILLINFFANCILPARLGDVYRPYMLKEDSGVSYPKALGTVLAERVLDLATVLLLLMISGVGLWRQGGPFLAVLAIGLAVVGLLVLLLGGMGRFGSRLSRFLPARIRSLYLPFQEGTLGSFRQLLPVGLQGMGIWLLEAGRLYLVALALGIHADPFLLLFAAQAVALIVAVPATPAGLGLVEGGVAGVLNKGGLPWDVAWSVSLVDRTISFLSLIAVGLVIFALRQVSRARSKNG